jgi:serine/threonine protein kinase
VPYLLKVSKLDKAQEELEAIKKLRNQVAESALALARDKVYGSGNEIGALLYMHRGTSSHGLDAMEPVTFRQLVFCHPHFEEDRGFVARLNKKCFKTAELAHFIEKVFDELRNIHFDSKHRCITTQNHYTKYFRGHRSAKRIAQILGRKRTRRQFVFLGERIMNPLKFLRELPKKMVINQGAIHGDLHPDNIVIDSDLMPHLIDFAWAATHRDVLLDFVLLENSIRFWHFPAASDIEVQRIVDRVLLDENGADQIMRIRFSDDRTAWYYKRLASLVSAIRQRARAALGEDFAMSKYLMTQFIVLYGLLRYDSYSPYVGTRALGMIARRLHSRKDLKVK